MTVHDVAIVGSGPAGYTAALYAARAELNPIVFEGFEYGGELMNTTEVENYPGFQKGIMGPELMEEMRAQAIRFGADLRMEVVDSIELEGDIKKLHVGDEFFEARAVILATGARWRHLGVPGEEEYRTRGVTYCPHCDGPLFRGKKVAVIGGGNSGVEATLDLAGVVGHVTVIEFLDELKADEVLLTALGRLDNVDVITGAATTSIDGDGTTVTGLSYTDRASGQDHSIDVSGVFVQIGLLPNTEWLSEAVELNNRGEVVIDERCRTSVPGIFAAGDCTTQAYKQIITSMGSGATASLAAFDHLIRSQA